MPFTRAWPQNPAVCLESVDVKNLSNLIESSYETRLAERVLKSIPKEDLQHEAANVDSVYLRAAWFVFRHAPRTVLFSGHNPLHASPSLLPYTLLWAAQFCYSATSVIDECHWRSHFLRSCLVQATDYFFQLEEPHWYNPSSIGVVWRHSLIHMHYPGRKCVLYGLRALSTSCWLWESLTRAFPIAMRSFWRR